MSLCVRVDCPYLNYTLLSLIVSIETVDSHKHLGLTYDTKLIFDIHCNEIVSKCLHKFDYLKTICKRVNGMTFLRLYKTFILPLIEFSNNCWIPAKTQINKLEKIQKKITKYILKDLIYLILKHLNPGVNSMH